MELGGLGIIYSKPESDEFKVPFTTTIEIAQDTARAFRVAGHKVLYRLSKEGGAASLTLIGEEDVNAMQHRANRLIAFADATLDVVCGFEPPKSYYDGFTS